jgi:hypothetical protein
MPAEITGKAPERKMKVTEPQDDYAGDDKEKAEKNKRTAKVMHTAESC